MLSLAQDGQLIGTIRPGIYKVLVGTSLIEVAEADLVLLHSSNDAREERSASVRTGKGARLGKFRAGPMFSTTLDLHGLTVRDALEMVGRKLNRALLAEVEAIRIIQPRDVRRLSRALHEYLSGLKYVVSIEPDEDNPDATWIRLLRSSGESDASALKPPSGDRP